MVIAATAGQIQGHDSRDSQASLSHHGRGHVSVSAGEHRAMMSLHHQGTKFLDQYCPLQQGSHQDVSSYLVYYQHLLVFFADGSHTGLQQPSQLAALCGSKTAPEALLFKMPNGGHIELLLATCQTDTMQDMDASHTAGATSQIADIMIETALQPRSGTSMWISLLFGSQGRADSRPRRYTTTDGDNYRLG